MPLALQTLPEGYSWQKEGTKGQGHPPPSLFIRKTDTKIHARPRYELHRQKTGWTAWKRDEIKKTTQKEKDRMQVKDGERKHRWIKPTSNRILQLLGLYNMSSQLRTQGLQPENGHKKRILAIKGQKVSAEGQSKSRSILTAEPTLRPRRRSETRHRQKKKKGGGWWRRRNGGTRDEQTERGMWRQSHGWIKRGKEFQRQIERERGRGEEGRRHMDLITSRWCHVCMSGNQPVGRQRWVYGAKPGLVCDGCREAVCLMCGRKAQSRAQRRVCGFVSDRVWFCCMQTADRILSSHISLRGEKTCKCASDIHSKNVSAISLLSIWFG